MTAPADGPLVLTLDVGTSSVRTLLFDRGARPVPGLEGRRPYSARTTAGGGYELDPEELLRLAGEALDEVLGRAGAAAGRVAAVACCTFWHSLLGLDPEGRPATPITTWGDTRSAPQAEELKARMDEKDYHARTGCFFHPSYLPPRLLWLGTGRAARWLSFGEFLYDRLFGRALATVSMASGSGLLDVHSCSYDEETLRAVGLAPGQLSPLGDVKDSFRGLREPYARRWPALRDVPWFPPVGDGACNNLGSGCSTPERIGLMVGTSGAMRVAREAERFEVPWGLFGYRIDLRRVVLGGALSDGGNLVDWLRATLRLGSPAEAEREVAAMEPGAHGLRVLPLLAGERSPGWAARARGAVAGLTLDTKPHEILRAAMEAVAFRFALIHDLLREAAPAAREVVASGAALLGSPAWLAILADVLGRPVKVSAEPEASSRGAALLALEALGLAPRLEDLPAAFGTTVEPDPVRHRAYREQRELQGRLYDLLVNP
jgi:gluconokinase